MKKEGIVSMGIFASCKCSKMLQNPVQSNLKKTKALRITSDKDAQFPQERLYKEWFYTWTCWEIGIENPSK